MGRFGCVAWAEQNGTRTEASTRKKASVHLRMGFPCQREKNGLFRAKDKVYTGIDGQGLLRPFAKLPSGY
jgi:hypothetical protein